jgi:nicotinamidase-related amidase
MKKGFVIPFCWCIIMASCGHNKLKTLTFHLERIDPATNKIQLATEKVPVNDIGIVVIDMWDKHWCKSWTAREAAMIPRMNKMLNAARKMGIQIIFSPSSVADFYKDSIQRKAVLSIPNSSEYICPSVEEIIGGEEKDQLEYRPYGKKYFEGSIYAARDTPGTRYKGYPPLPPFAETGGCECINRDCRMENVWHRQNKDLTIEESDLIVEGNNRSELFNICRTKGITHLLYAGGAGNMCLTFTRETSTINMSNRGVKCIYMEDQMISISGRGYNPETKKNDPAFTPERGDSLVLTHLKKYVAPSVKSYEVFPDMN